MPYKMMKKNGQFCVINSETGDNKGCSATHAMAIKHMRALYAAEGGAKMGKKELNDLTIKAYFSFINDPDTTDETLDTEALAEGLAEEVEIPTDTEEPETPQVQAPETVEQTDAQHGRIIATPVLSSDGTASVTPSIIVNIDYPPDLPVTDVVPDDQDKAQRRDVSEADKKRAVEEYGSVTFADPENKKYPVDTPEHIRAAWSYINMPKNAAKYSASKVASIKRKIVSAWKSKIGKDGPPQANDKETEWDIFMDQLTYKIKSLFGVEDDGDQALMIWKENGEYRWMTRYSNNFLDDDNPKEIIAEQSHRLFEQDIDKGLAPYPELWLWHVPEWKLGQSDWVAWDDSGFALAAGHFYPGHEAQAEWLSKQKGWAVSHGMPTDSIERDATNPNIIIRHRTREISLLPLVAAANKRTGFVVLKETPMAIPDEKKQALIQKWGLKPELLEELEALNAEDAKKAVAAGVERKEQTVEQTPPAQPEKDKQVSEPQVPQPPTPAEQPVTRQEIADAIAAVVVPMIETTNKNVTTLEATLTTLTKELETLKQADEEKIVKQASGIPAASLSALIFQRVVGNDKTTVKDGDPLANSKPKEAETPKGNTGIAFLDTLLADGRK